MARWSLVLLAASLLGLAEGGAGSLWQSRGVTLTRTAAQSRVRCSNGICRKEVYDPERREGAASRLPKPVGRGMWGGNSTMRALGFVSPAEWRPQRVSHQLVAWQHKLSTRLVQARTDAVGSAQRFGGHVEAFIVNGLRMPGMPRLHCNKTLTFWGNMLAGAISRRYGGTVYAPLCPPNHQQAEIQRTSHLNTLLWVVAAWLPQLCSDGDAPCQRDQDAAADQGHEGAGEPDAPDPDAWRGGAVRAVRASRGPGLRGARGEEARGSAGEADHKSDISTRVPVLFSFSCL